MTHLIDVPAHVASNLIVDLDGPFAVRVDGACFRDGEESEHEIDFFRLWGRTIRRHYNGRTASTSFQFVDGEGLELFNAHYGMA